MPATKQSNIGLWQGWVPGEDGWGDEMNYNLRSLDALVQGFVLGILASPPGSPSSGDSYIVSNGGSGAFNGQDGKIARYDGSAWEFYPAKDGWRVFNQSDNAYYRRAGGAWQQDTAEAATGSTLAVRTPNGQINVANPTSGAHTVNRDYADSNYEKKRQNNLTATSDPSATDDASAGYEVLSRWVNVSSGEIFICLDASNGAANWGKATLTLDELGSAALADVGTAASQVPTNADLNISEWDTAYSWGDHAQVGYFSASFGKADQATAEEGTNDALWMSPEQTKQAIDYNREAVEQVNQASLVLDFAKGEYYQYNAFTREKTDFSTALTFTRASDKTGYTPAGLATAGSGVAVENEWNPSINEFDGLSIHEQRTNLFTESEFRNGLSDADLSGGLVSASSIDGFTGAIAFGYDGVTDSFVYKQLDITNSQDFVLSFFVEIEGGAPIVNGAQDQRELGLVFEGGVFSTGVSVEKVGSNLYRCSRVVTSGGSGSSNFGVIKYANNLPRTFKVTGYDLEQGSFVTPYIPTTTAQAQRIADGCSIPDIDTSDWFNASEMTFVVEGQFQGNGVAFFSIGTNSSNRVSLYFAGTTLNCLILPESTTASVGTAVGKFKASLLVSQTENIKVSLNGDTPVDTGVSASALGLSSLDFSISNLAGGVPSGNMKLIKAYPYALTDTRLQQESTL